MGARTPEVARLDVYANPDATEAARTPFFLDVQNDHIQGLKTRVVAPLWAQAWLAVPMEDLNPTFTVAGQAVVMDTPALGAVPAALLRRPVANLASDQLAIQNALDALLGGYCRGLSAVCRRRGVPVDASNATGHISPIKSA